MPVEHELSVFLSGDVPGKILAMTRICHTVSTVML